MAGSSPVSALSGAAVLGAGTMGTQIALSLALGGVEVNLWARRRASFAEAGSRISAAIDLLADHGLVEPDRKASIISRISCEPDLEAAVAGREFVIEAIAEDLALKQRLICRAERSTEPESVLSSTTSAISPTEIQSPLSDPSRFCVAHYAQPAHLVQLVEVVPGSATSNETTDFTIGYLEKTGKSAVLCPDIPGFLWARIQHAVLREFASLVGQGLVTPEACDRVLKEGYAARLPAMGAFEHADLAGLDLLTGAAARAVWEDLSNVRDPSETPVGKLHSQGHTGMKSGLGFYDWKKRDAEQFKLQRDEEIIRRTKLQRGGKVVL